MSKFAAILIALSALALALSAGAEITETPIGESTAPSATGAAPPPPPAPKRVRKRVAAAEVEVEPAHARLKLRDDTSVYAKPSKSGAVVARVHAGKKIEVTGSTRSFLRVRLKTGTVGFIVPTAVHLVVPTDQTFLLNADSPVYSQPNRWGKVLAQVHRGRNVHVVGMALDYMKIRMKNGTEGFIPVSALQ